MLDSVARMISSEEVIWLLVASGANDSEQDTTEIDLKGLDKLELCCMMAIEMIIENFVFGNKPSVKTINKEISGISSILDLLAANRTCEITVVY